MCSLYITDDINSMRDYFQREKMSRESYIIYFVMQPLWKKNRFSFLLFNSEDQQFLFRRTQLKNFSKHIHKTKHDLYIYKLYTKEQMIYMPFLKLFTKRRISVTHAQDFINHDFIDAKSSVLTRNNIIKFQLLRNFVIHRSVLYYLPTLIYK